jgi:hypothetical protein
MSNRPSRNSTFVKSLFFILLPSITITYYAKTFIYTVYLDFYRQLPYNMWCSSQGYHKGLAGIFRIEFQSAADEAQLYN